MARRRLADRCRVWLLAELPRWQDAGIVSEEQAGRLLELYETPAEVAQRKRAVALFTLKALATFLVVLGAFLLIGYHWQTLARAAQLAVILGVWACTCCLGFYLRYQRRAFVAAEVVFFVACVLYGCGAWLTAEVLQLRTHYPDGFWIWALTVLPFVLCVDSFAFHALLVGLLTAWLGTELFDWGFPPAPRLFEPWLVPPNACLTLPWLVAPGLLWAYRRRSLAVVSLYVPLLAVWLILEPLPWKWSVNPMYLTGASGAFLVAAAACHPRGSRLAIPYRVCGVLLLVTVLAGLSFVAVGRDFLRQSESRGHLVAGCVVLFAGTLAILTADRLSRPWTVAGRSADGSVAGLLRRQGLALGLLLYMAGLCLWNAWFGGLGNLPGDPHPSLGPWDPIILVPALVANAGMVLLAFWLLRLGLQEDRAVPFGAGVLCFLLWVVLRYLELFAGVGGMLGASVFCFLCAAGLFGMARFWMQRKELQDV